MYVGLNGEGATDLIMDIREYTGPISPIKEKTDTAWYKQAMEKDTYFVLVNNSRKPI